MSKSSPAGKQQQTPNKRVKVTLACVICRKKKVKCDGIQPSCSRCTSIGNNCEYSDPPKKRGPPKGYVEIIENRAHRIDSLLGNHHHHFNNNNLFHSMQQQQNQEQQQQHHHRHNENQQINNKSLIHVSAVDYDNNNSVNQQQQFQQHQQHHQQLQQSFKSSTTTTTTTVSFVKDNNQQQQPINALICLIAGAVDAVRIALIAAHQNDIVHGSNGTLHNFLMTDNVFFFNQGAEAEKHILNGGKTDADHDFAGVWTENFFNHFNFMFPILSRPEFLFQLERNELNPLLKLAVLILGCRFDKKEQRRIEYEKILYQQLFGQSHDLFHVPDISTVQALAIMCWYTYIIGDLYKCYNLRHQLVQMLDKLNFGYESSTLNGGQHSPQPQQQDIHYNEMKRRAFWVSFVIDQWLAASCAGGERLLSMERSNFDCKLPQLEDNQLFALYSRQQQNSAARQQQQKFNCSSSYLSIESALQINSFNEIIKLSKIVADICQSDKSYSEMESSLTEWLLQLPSYLDYGNRLSTHEEPSPISKLYRILYYTVQIMLNNNNTANNKKNDLLSASIRTTAANTMIHISEQMIELGQEKYLYNIFFSSLTLAASVHLDNAIGKEEENTSSLYKSISIIKQLNCTFLSKREFDNMLDQFSADKYGVFLDIYPSPTHSSSSVSQKHTPPPQQRRKSIKRPFVPDEDQEAILNSPIPSSIIVHSQGRKPDAAAIIICNNDMAPPHPHSQHQHLQEQFDLNDIFPIINMMDQPIIDIPPPQQQQQMQQQVHQQQQWPNWVDFFDGQTIDSSTTTCSPASYITPSHSPSLSLCLKEEEVSFDLLSATTDQNFFTSFPLL